MKVKISKKSDNLTYSIVGVPRSGTTIFTKIMNSIENSMCISEPIRSMHSINLKNRITSKYEIESRTDKFLLKYFKYVKNKPDCKIGGLKETYSHTPSRINREVNKIFDKSDFMIFMLREPKSTFSGWKQLKWGNGELKPRYRYNVEMFCKIYEAYIEQYHKTKMIKPSFLIRYEDFCENFSEEWMNNIFKGYIDFEGEIGDLEEFVGVGDSKCRGTDQILEARTECSNLTDKEIKIINERLLPLYKNLRGYGYY